MKEESEAPAAGSALPATATVRVTGMREAGPAWVRLSLFGVDWSPTLGDFENVEIAVAREWAADLWVGSLLSIRIEPTDKEASNASAPSGAPKAVSESSRGASLKGK